MTTCAVDNNMLIKQQELTNQINQLVAQSSQSLLCGPGTECERAKNTEDLQKKYLAAQTTVQNAPYLESHAEKDFYVYTQGDAAYNALVNKRLREKAEAKANEFLSTFNENVTNATQLNDILSSLTTNYQHVLELSNTYLEENSILKAKIETFGTDLVTSDRKTFYEIQNYDILKSWYTIWYWMYYVLVVVFAVGIFISKSSYSLIAKIGLLVLFALYPYIINYIVFYLLKTIANVVSLLPKNIYTNL